MTTWLSYVDTPTAPFGHFKNETHRVAMLDPSSDKTARIAVLTRCSGKGTATCRGELMRQKMERRDRR